jgi:hypothetical protein
MIFLNIHAEDILDFSKGRCKFIYFQKVIRGSSACKEKMDPWFQTVAIYLWSFTIYSEFVIHL